MNLTQCPYKIGDTVKFTPSEYDLAKLPPLELMGIEVAQVGRVVTIEDKHYLYIESSVPGMGLDWEMFTLVLSA